MGRRVEERGRRGVPHPVLKGVSFSAFFATEVDEEVRRSGGVLGGHVPHDPEGVAGHLTNLDIAGGGKRGLRVGHLPSKGTGTAGTLGKGSSGTGATAGGGRHLPRGVRV